MMVHIAALNWQPERNLTANLCRDNRGAFILLTIHQDLWYIQTYAGSGSYDSDLSIVNYIKGEDHRLNQSADK